MRGIGAGTRVFELLDRSPAIPPNTGIILPSTRRGTISFKNIQFEYPSRKGVEILKDFNLDIGIGESVAIVCVLENPPRITHLDRGLSEGRAGAGSRQFNLSFCATMTLSRAR